MLAARTTQTSRVKFLSLSSGPRKDSTYPLKCQVCLLSFCLLQTMIHDDVFLMRKTKAKWKILSHCARTVSGGILHESPTSLMTIGRRKTPAVASDPYNHSNDSLGPVECASSTVFMYNGLASTTMFVESCFQRLAPKAIQRFTNNSCKPCPSLSFTIPLGVSFPQTSRVKSTSNVHSCGGITNTSPLSHCVPNHRWRTTFRSNGRNHTVGKWISSGCKELLN